ncbi:MAG: DUF4384 domain-containing protein [Okeania sp. SIO2D1]|nr:DUF4384 domain-containing protein [Okeania sp. SIO2D1]
MSEIWEKLWKEWEKSGDDTNISIEKIDSSEDSTNIYIEESASEINASHLGISSSKWNPKPQPNWPSFSVGSKINYQFRLNNSGYLIVTEKFASGEIYCIAPSVLSPPFPVPWGTLILPKDKDDPFVIQPPIGYEEIIAVYSKEEPQLDWLPQPEDEPLELQTENLASLLNHVKKNNCQLMRYKYLITA